METSEEENMKVNLYLFGINAVFLLMTFLACLFTDGRPYCVLQLAKKCCPNATWVSEQVWTSNVSRKCEVDLSRHVYGSKRGSTISMLSTFVLTNDGLNKPPVILI